jgi:SAM-dependent methyltransferase
MPNMYLQQVKDYFHNKAIFYDDVEEQTYWELSDLLLWDTFSKQLDKLPEKFIFLDAGGGTGRWTKKILDAYPHSKGVIKDLSPDMLAVAKEKFSKTTYLDRIELIHGNLLEKNSSFDKHFDLIFNFHNVLGFVSDSRGLVKNLSFWLKKGGTLISFAPNLFHGIFFNISLGKINNAYEMMSTSKGRFTNEMPEINFFSPKQLKKLYLDVGLNVVYETGFPTAIYPGYQETQAHGTSERLENLLSDKKKFKQILEIEKSLIIKYGEELSSRGNNIFIVGRKF